MRIPPSSRVPEQGPDWFLVATEACGGGTSDLGFFLEVWVYIEEFGIDRGVHKAGGHALPPWARPPPSWAPCCSTDVLLPPIYTYVPPNDQIQSQNPNSTVSTFCIHEIPSWGLFRSSAGEGRHHGGLLHQHHSLSDDVCVVYLRPSGP